MLYRGMDRAALDAAYNNTAAVGQARRDRYVAGWSVRSDAFRQTHRAVLDLPYGAGARQRLDVFPCGAAAAPTLVYIHGGYWQTNDKEPYAFLGEALLPAGFNLALVEYTLAPAARLDAIVAEVRAAVAWTIDHAKEHGGDPARVFVAGHSAGGHLTAMAMHDPRVAGGLAISGIFDLEPIRLNYLNEKLRLDPGEDRPRRRVGARTRRLRGAGRSTRLP
jgi:acetyl esterase/lipase